MTAVIAAVIGSLGGIIVPRIFNATANSTVFDPGDAFAQYRLNNDGTILITNDVQPNWLNIPGATGLFEVRATLLSGEITGTFNVWLALNVSRSWTLSQTIVGFVNGSMLLEIRRISTGIVVDTATITIYVSVENGS